MMMMMITGEVVMALSLERHVTIKDSLLISRNTCSRVAQD
jgi:hypothetical protein